METFEDVFAEWNGTASVADLQHYVFAIATCADSNSSARTIVLSRVLQKILHDERGVTFLASHQKSAGKFLFNLHVRRFRQRAKIIQPFINQLTKIHRC